MKPSYTKTEFKLTKVNDGLRLICYNCNNIFYKKKKFIQLVLKKHIGKKINKHYEGSCKYCSKECQTSKQITKKIVNCKNCNKDFLKKLSEVKCSKNHFCSKSCAATYNNKHKTFGIRRSKLEKYIEERLDFLYSNLQIHYNKKEAINSELDIYIPSLNIAFELNGILHYKPIYGIEKLY